MSDAPDFEPTDPPPRYRIEGDSIEELLDRIKEILPESPDFRLTAGEKERIAPPEEAPEPERLRHGDLARLADELSNRLERTAYYADDAEAQELSFDRSDWRPSVRSGPGDVLHRHNVRRARRLEAEAGYVWLHDAMLARELTDRTEAVRELERVADVARLERLAEHSPQRVTRRAALDALYRIHAVPALESAALYIRPEVFTPKKPKPTEDVSGAKSAEFYDDTRDHAVDLLAQLADDGEDLALQSLGRVVRYDFSRDALSRFRALRRLGERLDRIEARGDWEMMGLIYRESRSPVLRRQVVGRLAEHLPDLEQAGAVDALLAIADVRADLQDAAEAAVHRLEHGVA